MARRKKRRKNPSTLFWAAIGAGTVVVGAGAYAGYRVMAKRKRRAQLRKLPPPPGELPTEPRRPPETPEAAAAGCGPDYPAFIFDGEGCVPTAHTPAGIYVGEGCTDFVFVNGAAGEQLEYLTATIQQAAQASSDPGSPSADPTTLAANFLSTFWGECQWPPPPTAPPRIVHLYQAMTYVLGREVLDAGGRVLGTSDPEIVDEQIAERLAAFGLTDFDPDVVPEIELPDALLESGAAQVQIAFQ